MEVKVKVKIKMKVRRMKKKHHATRMNNNEQFQLLLRQIIEK